MRETPKKRFSIYSIFTSAEMILVQKDLHAMWAPNSIRFLLIMLPLLLVVVIPAVCFVTIGSLKAMGETPLPESLLSLLPESSAQLENKQAWLEAFSTLICPMLYLCVPILCASASASCVFVQENKDGTMETLFLSSLSARAIYNTKLMLCVMMSVFISLLSFLAFGITLTVGDIITGAPFFMSFQWAVIVVLLMPVLSFFSASVMSLILSRTHSMEEALKTTGYLLLPVVVLFLMQLAGVLKLSTLVLAVFAVLMAVISIVIYNKSAGRFQPENLLFRHASE